MVEVTIRDSMIRLNQFLKLAGAIDSGSDVKALLASDEVTVNGIAEHQRGRQLVRGDVVTLGDTSYRVA